MNTRNHLVEIAAWLWIAAALAIWFAQFSEILPTVFQLFALSSHWDWGAT